MNRRYQFRKEADKHWPALTSFLTCYLHQDWDLESATPEAAVDLAISDHHLESRQQVAREWRAWQRRYGTVADVRDIVIDGFGVNVWFKKPHEAGDFMQMVYEKLIASIKAETDTWTK